MYGKFFYQKSTCLKASICEGWSGLGKLLDIEVLTWFRLLNDLFGLLCYFENSLWEEWGWWKAFGYWNNPGKKWSLWSRRTVSWRYAKDIKNNKNACLSQKWDCCPSTFFYMILQGVTFSWNWTYLFIIISFILELKFFFDNLIFVCLFWPCPYL